MSSTNPFRTPNPQNTAGNSAPSLQIDTKVPHKSVSFKSPDTIIPTDSLPGSPESFRLPAPVPGQLPVAPDYGPALHSDPFSNTTFDVEADTPIQEALQNAQLNTKMTAQKPRLDSQAKDAVNHTLSQFANRPRRPSEGQSSDTKIGNAPERRTTMDVDAFKRLLLTGQSTDSTVIAPAGGSQQTSIMPTVATSENSSSADSASISQRSMLEAPTYEDSSRTSTELETGEEDALQRTWTSNVEHKKKPPPPPPQPRRHARPPAHSREVSSADRPSEVAESPTEKPNAQFQDIAETDEPSVIVTGHSDEHTLPKRRPTPPLSRRKSQNAAARPSMTPTNSGQSTRLTPDTTTIPSSAPARVPPPPPARRADSTNNDRRPSLDFSTPEEEAFPDNPHENGARPPLMNRSSSTPKRASLGPPPALPAPRRNRASSKSSINSQTPSIGGGSSSRPSGELPRPPGVNHNDSSSIVAAPNILLDLAALQREIDAARGKF